MNLALKIVSIICVGFTFTKFAVNATCVKQTPFQALEGAEPLIRISVSNERQCVVRCIKQKGTCFAAVFYKLENKNVCQLYGGNSDSPNLNVISDPATSLYEILDNCTTSPKESVFMGNATSASRSMSAGITKLVVWSHWTVWSECSQRCGGGEQSRFRTCENCPKRAEKKFQEQDRKCNTKSCVHLKASASTQSETSSDDCTEYCAKRSKRNVLKCFSYTECVLVDLGKAKSCPCQLESEATWGSWSIWSQCSESCGQGRQSRQRVCSAPGQCQGSATNTRSCTGTSDGGSAWTAWESWQQCSKACGQGIQKRWRDCIGVGNCDGKSTDIRSCYEYIGPCPKWLSWSSWSQCSSSCGSGMQTRTRPCSHGNRCRGMKDQKKKCNSGHAQLGNTGSCPTWGQWNSWGECSRTCGSGSQKRERFCTIAGQCYGPSVDTRSCKNDLVCPSWNYWSSWTQCSASCGKGIRKRSRTCTVYGECPGKDAEMIQCHCHPCPTWSDWSPWQQCSVSCGKGIRKRSRTCTVYGKCPGKDAEMIQCHSEPCPTWSDWSPWQQCSSTCGRGTKARNRNCLYGTNCRGLADESQHCDSGPCPTWGPWGHWSQCQKTTNQNCGAGTQTRTRQCQLGYGCLGDNKQSQDCDLGPCPTWGPWGHWSQCQATTYQNCGAGTQTRTRQCQLGYGCLGDNKQSQDCDLGPCPWGPWGHWSQCQTTTYQNCGAGTQTRTRQCQHKYGCLGDNKQSQDCDSGPCPTWGPWGHWSQCQTTTYQNCGAGTQTRTRECQLGYGCLGDNKQSQDCDLGPCPTWGPWGHWSQCQATTYQNCGTGTLTRTRQCQLGYGCLGDNKQSQDCDLGPCPWGPWGHWSQCQTTTYQNCGAGTQTRTRQCQHKYGCFGDNKQSQDCDLGPCQTWGTWGHWSQCQTTTYQNCGAGTQTRTRQCQLEYGCLGDNKQSQDCDLGPCPTWGPWGHWSQCQTTTNQNCGAGTQTRTRQCQLEYGCLGDKKQSQDCDLGPCPTWGTWGHWSQCQTTTYQNCGTGTQTRTRQCQLGYGCLGDDKQSQDCDLGSCPTWGTWGHWSQCQTTTYQNCGTGTQTRTRQCQLGYGCLGDNKQSQDCDLGSCAYWSQWNSWGPCSSSCGTGMRQRYRRCKGGTAKTDCQGIAKIYQTCDAEPCPTWTEWSYWNHCSVTCGTGMQSRARACSHGNLCQGDSVDYQTCCEQQLCASTCAWTQWTHWGHCSTTCGAGTLTRTRQCSCSYACTTGVYTETKSCIIQPCSGYYNQRNHSFYRNRHIGQYQ